MSWLALSDSFYYMCYGSTAIIKKKSFSVGIVFIRQNLMSTHARFWRIKTIPMLKGLNNMALEAHRTQWVKVIQRARTFWLISVYQLQLKQQALTQRFYNVGPASVTLDQRYKNNGPMPRIFRLRRSFFVPVHTCVGLAKLQNRTRIRHLNSLDRNTVDLVIFACLNYREFLIFELFMKPGICELSISMIVALL